MAKFLRCVALLIFLYMEISANFLKDNLKIEEISDNFPEPPDCGIGKISKASNRIHGGVPAEPHELPWMVFFSMGCGGTFINSRWVLTAAHCFISRNPAEKKIIDNAKAFVGAQNCGMYNKVVGYYCDSNATAVEIGKYILHEKYAGKENDIALVQLKDSVKFTDKVQPICLPYNNQAGGSSLFDKEVEVSGWGRTEHGLPSIHLLKVGVKVWTAHKCEARKKVESESEICAGGVVGKDACDGDSGGPLYMQFTTSTDGNKNVPFYQVGIVSWGPSPCGQDANPGVYTNVTTYIPWIRSKILSNE